MNIGWWRCLTTGKYSSRDEYQLIHHHLIIMEKGRLPWVKMNKSWTELCLRHLGNLHGGDYVEVFLHFRILTQLNHIIGRQTIGVNVHTRSSSTEVQLDEKFLTNVDFQWLTCEAHKSQLHPYHSMKKIKALELHKKIWFLLTIVDFDCSFVDVIALIIFKNPDSAFDCGATFRQVFTEPDAVKQHRAFAYEIETWKLSVPFMAWSNDVNFYFWLVVIVFADYAWCIVVVIKVN